MIFVNDEFVRRLEVAAVCESSIVCVVIRTDMMFHQRIYIINMLSC